MPSPDLTLRFQPSASDPVFDGIGAVSAGASTRLLIDYPEPVRSRILDLLFKPNYGAAFQHLKVEVGGDMNSTDGTEPSHMRKRGEANFHRGYEWWLMKEAVRRNPNIVLKCLAWSAPGWFEGGFWSQDCADYYVSFLRGARDVHGLKIRYVGLWNEREYDPAFVKLLRRTLDANGFADVGIVASDMNGPPENQYKIAEDAVRDPELAAALHAIGVHYPYTKPPESALTLQRQGKRLWSSEDGEWDWQTMRPLSGLRAQKINRNVVDRELTATAFWSPITSYYGNLPAPDSGVVTANTPWSGAFEIKPELWHVAHTTQFAQVGWTIVRSGCARLPKGGSVASYASPGGKDQTMVFETARAGDPQRVRIEGIARPLRAWLSVAGRTMVKQAKIRPIDRMIEVEVPADAVLTLTTTRGQRKGAPRSAKSKPFPLPYREDFEGYDAQKTPRYLSDFSWAFETAEEGGRKYLRQVIERQGITWADLPYAATYLGDPEWTDVAVSAQVALEPGVSANDWAGVVIHASPGSTWQHFSKPHPAGYTLRLARDGSWSLTDVSEVLAQGRVDAPQGWSDLRLRAVGKRLEGWIEGRKVVEVEASSFPKGLAGLACGNHPARFDNFLVTASGAEK